MWSVNEVVNSGRLSMSERKLRRRLELMKIRPVAVKRSGVFNRKNFFYSDEDFDRVVTNFVPRPAGRPRKDGAPTKPTAALPRQTLNQIIYDVLTVRKIAEIVHASLGEVYTAVKSLELRATSRPGGIVGELKVEHYSSCHLDAIRAHIQGVRANEQGTTFTRRVAREED